MPALFWFILSPGGEAAVNPLESLEWSLADATREFQIDYITRHVDRVRGNMTDAAKRLGLHRSNLYRKMRQLGMQTDEVEDEDEISPK